MVRRRLMSAAEITGVPGTVEAVWKRSGSLLNRLDPAGAARICDYPPKSIRSTYLREFLESESCR